MQWKIILEREIEASIGRREFETRGGNFQSRVFATRSIYSSWCGAPALEYRAEQILSQSRLWLQFVRARAIKPPYSYTSPLRFSWNSRYAIRVIVRLFSLLLVSLSEEEVGRIERLSIRAVERQDAWEREPRLIDTKVVKMTSLRFLSEILWMRKHKTVRF